MTAFCAPMTVVDEHRRRQQQLAQRAQRAERLAARGGADAAVREVGTVLELAPENDKARRLRALLRAKRGDLSGALREIAWWRARYGDVAADTLVDEVRKASGRGQGGVPGRSR